MKLFLLRIATFTIGFILLIIVPTLLISRYDNLDKRVSENHNIISLQTKSKFDSLDILFVGNSYCYSSIDTRYLDSLKISTFNLGIATAGIEFYDLIVNDYFDHINSPPKKVMLLVTPMTFTSKSDNFSFYPIHRYLENEKSNINIAINYNKTGDIVKLYKKSTKKGLINLLSKNNFDKYIKRANNKGFLSSNRVINSKVISKDEHLYLPLKNECFKNYKLEKLLKIADEIKKRGSEVLFFELPTHLLNNYFKTEYLSEYKHGLNQLKKKFKFISIDPSLFNESNFRNIDHMNCTGAKIATQEIIKQLNKIAIHT